MKTAVYSDVHGNLPAFENFISKTKSCVDLYLNLGDLVNYGPWSNECVDLALSIPSLANILGNHEDLFIDPLLVNQEIDLVQLFFNATYPMFDRVEEISLFQSTHVFNRFLASHTIGEQRIYPDTSIVLEQNYLIGHSHHQFHYMNSGFELINPGSIGQNRKKIGLFEYAIYDDEKDSFEFYSESYNTDSLFQKMHALKYPEACLEYYLSKL
jgi:hypothetical protein